MKKDKKNPSFSIGSNVSLADSKMIRYTVPNWLRVFGSSLKEIVLIIDPQSPTGRLGKQYDYYAKLDDLIYEVKKLEELDSRVRSTMIKTGKEMEKDLRHWFKRGYPIRCQSGTPIAAFINAVEECTNDFVLRCDSDFLFFENGFLNDGYDLLSSEEFDIIEPPMLGVPQRNDISLGAFMVIPSLFKANCLPIKAHKIDILRRIHRKIQRLPTYINLEEMISVEKAKSRVKHCNLDGGLGKGFSLHLINRTDVMLPGFGNVIAHIELGDAPKSQTDRGRNFDSDLWTKSYWKTD